MSRGKPTPVQLIADAMAALADGLGVSEVSRKTGLPKATVSRLRTQFAPKLKQVGTEKQNELAELIGASLRSKFGALGAIEGQLSNEAWRASQSAEGLAELHKTIQAATDRTLSALEPEGEEQGQDGGETTS